MRQIDAEKNKLEELKNRKKRRVLPRSSDTIDKDININDFLD